MERSTKPTERYDKPLERYVKPPEQVLAQRDHYYRTFEGVQTEISRARFVAVGLATDIPVYLIFLYRLLRQFFSSGPQPAVEPTRPLPPPPGGIR